MQKGFYLRLSRRRQPAIEIEYRFRAQHIPNDFCSVAAHHQAVVKIFDILSCRCQSRQRLFAFCNFFLYYFYFCFIMMYRFCRRALLACQGYHRKVEGPQGLKDLLLFFLQTDSGIILLLFIGTNLPYHGPGRRFQHSRYKLCRIGLSGGRPKENSGIFRFVHFQRNIQLFPRLQPCNQGTQTVDFTLSVCDIFIGEDSFVHIHFRICFCGIHMCSESTAFHCFSGTEQRFFRCIVFVYRFQGSIDAGNIGFQTRNIGTVTGSENIRHPFLIIDYAFLGIDFHNPQMHQFMQEGRAAAIQTNDSQLSHLNNCHTFPQPFRLQSLWPLLFSAMPAL